MGRSLPRAIADAKSAGVEAGNRAPPFESQTRGGGRRGGSVGDDSNRVNGGSSITKAHKTTHATAGKTGSGVSTEDMIAGNPRRAMEELSLRAKLEVVRGEVDATLKMHATMASGERTSWLKQIERQNEENAYEVGTQVIRCRASGYTCLYPSACDLRKLCKPLCRFFDLIHPMRGWLVGYFIILYYFLPIVVSVVCLTGPHPPLRLARRPNRGHIGGALLRYMPMMFLSRVGSALPPSSTVKSMHQGNICYVCDAILHSASDSCVESLQVINPDNLCV